MAMGSTLMHYSHPFFTLLIPIILVFRFIRTYTKSRTSLRHPPRPPSLPLIGHLHLLSSRLPQCLQNLARRYGPLMQIKLGASSFIMVSSSSMAEYIFKTLGSHFSSRFEFGPNEYNIYKGSGFVTAPYGEYWRFMKKLSVTKLFSGRQLDRFRDLRDQEIKNLLNSVKACCEKGEACDLGVEIANLVNNLMWRMAMSRSFSKNGAKEMRAIVMDIMQVASKLSVNQVFGPLKKVDLFGKGKKLRMVLWKYDNFMEEIMKGYEENEEKACEEEERDLISMFMEWYRDPNAEMKLTRNQIKFFFLELFMASIDTLAATLQCAMAELINHPQVLKKLREEIDSVVGSTQLLKESDLRNLPYLQSTVKEALRLHPPATLIHRECNKDCKINGYDIKAGSRILVNAYAIMRDPITWSNADDFVPERFYDNLTEDHDDQNQTVIKSHDFSYVPFGGGRRGCIGEKHAYMVMHATIGALIQCFDWKVKGGEKAYINVGSGFNGAMPHPLVCYPVQRCDPF